MAMTLKITGFWNVTSRSVVRIHTYIYEYISVSEERTSSIFTVEW
jgi:hypothetical protein